MAMCFTSVTSSCVRNWSTSCKRCWNRSGALNRRAASSPMMLFWPWTRSTRSNYPRLSLPCWRNQSHAPASQRTGSSVSISPGSTTKTCGSRIWSKPRRRHCPSRLRPWDHPVTRPFGWRLARCWALTLRSNHVKTAKRWRSRPPTCSSTASAVCSKVCGPAASLKTSCDWPAPPPRTPGKTRSPPARMPPKH